MPLKLIDSSQRWRFFFIALQVVGLLPLSVKAHISSTCATNYIFVDRHDEHVWNFFYCATPNCDLSQAPRLGNRAYDGRELVAHRKKLRETLENAELQTITFLLTAGFSMLAIPRMRTKIDLLDDRLAEEGILNLSCPWNFKRRAALFEEILQDIDREGDPYDLRRSTGIKDREITWKLVESTKKP